MTKKQKTKKSKKQFHTKKKIVGFALLISLWLWNVTNLQLAVLSDYHHMYSASTPEIITGAILILFAIIFIFYEEVELKCWKSMI